jgi:hypothetical protein
MFLDNFQKAPTVATHCGVQNGKRVYITRYYIFYDKSGQVVQTADFNE